MSEPQRRPAEQWVTVSGLVHPDGTVTLAPLFPSWAPRTPPRAPEGAAETLSVDFLDLDGNQLRRGIVPTEELCEHVGGAGPVPRSFGSPLLLPADTCGLRIFSAAGTELKTVRATENPPQLSLEWAAPEAEVEGVGTLQWHGEHPDRLRLSYLCLYSHDGDRWRALSLPQESESVAIDFDELPGGPECRLRVIASDGINFTVADTAPFGVMPKGARPLILSVEPTPPVGADEFVVLRGQAFDMEREDFVSELHWTSSRDGEIGSGTLIATKLSPGQHLLGLDVTDPHRTGLRGAPSVSVVMELQVIPAPRNGEQS